MSRGQSHTPFRRGGRSVVPQRGHAIHHRQRGRRGVLVRDPPNPCLGFLVSVHARTTPRSALPARTVNLTVASPWGTVPRSFLSGWAVNLVIGDSGNVPRGVLSSRAVHLRVPNARTAGLLFPAVHVGLREVVWEWETVPVALLFLWGREC